MPFKGKFYLLIIEQCIIFARFFSFFSLCFPFIFHCEEVEIDEEAEAMIDLKESIDLVAGIEEDQKAGIESPISTGAKVGTENKIENPRRKVSLCENLIH